MIYYEDKIKKALKKGKPPKDIFVHINNAFIALESTGDFSLFDIKKLKGRTNKTYYRLRKGKYRAIFYFKDNDYFIIALDKRGDVYKKWE